MPPRSLISSPQFLFALLLVFRSLNAFCVQTFFQPDEYFQSLEPAWQWAFGPDSGAWITWEWKERLRSSLHPLIFAAGYKALDQILNHLGADQHAKARALITLPRLMQAVSAATTDFCTWHLARRLYGRSDRSTQFTLALTVLSPWQWFCSIRTFSNSLETALTIVALDAFPWDWFERPSSTAKRDQSSNGLGRALACAAVACVLRPTNLLVWLAISAYVLSHCGLSSKTTSLIVQAIISGGIVLSISASMDRAFFDSWTFPPLRFLYFNVVQSLAGFYGRNRPDYYFTEGLPLLLITATPFAITGLWQGLQSSSIRFQQGQLARFSPRFALSVAIIMSVITLSLISHKEVRFIYPLLPMLHILAARPLAQFSTNSSKHTRKWRLLVVFSGVAANLVIAFYVSLVHQRGVIDVMHYLRHRQEARFPALSDNEDPSGLSAGMSIAFLMPCHSTPWRTHLVYPDTNAWALTCEPPINKTPQERDTYLDEADVFYDDPVAWIKANMEDIEGISTNARTTTLVNSGTRPWPEYLVFFEQLHPTLAPVLANTRYKECKRFFNTHWHDDWRRQGDVIVWCMKHWELSKDVE